jgi:hypothetical protein
LILAAGIVVAGDGLMLPDHTPGVANPEVTPAEHPPDYLHGRLEQNDPAAGQFTNKLKIQKMQELGLPGKPSDYEEDHFRPLELGGAPRDPLDNLDPPPEH